MKIDMDSEWTLGEKYYSNVMIYEFDRNVSTSKMRTENYR